MGNRKRNVKNPLAKRLPRELLGDWRKYLVVSLFLILTIGFVSGMYVANESMMTAIQRSVTEYKLEDGHFELEREAPAKALAAIQTGEKADVKQYFLDEARKELDESFETEFEREFTAEFGAEFPAKFDETFEAQTEAALLVQGLNADAAKAMLPAALEQAKQSGAYRAAYEEAYEEAYREAYGEAYETAYDEAWESVLKKVDEDYAEAEEDYELNDPDFRAVPVTLHENFFKNESEDNDNDGVEDGTVRVYARTEDVNLACLMDGALPAGEDEIAIDRMHADNADVQVGDSITVGGKSFRVVGLIAYVNYSTLHEKSTDLIFDALKFNVAMVTQEGFDRLGGAVRYSYAWRYETGPADEKEEKALSDDFLKALLTQTVVTDCELKEYLPRYANPAVNFAAEDMGSDEAIGGVLLDILIVIIAFIFAVTVSNTIARESKAIGTLRTSGYSRGELLRHYLSMPVIVTLISAVIGNILGYTVFKYVVASMYYNSYSLPAYETVWDPTAFVKTTLIPLGLMFLVNLFVIAKMLRHTPLQFLRHDLKKARRKKAVRLPNWKFFRRFRLRIMLQNVPNYLILFFGVFFIATMLAMAVGMPDTLNYYKQNAGKMMFAKYQYVLKSSEDETGSRLTTAAAGAEEFSMRSLQRKGGEIDEEVSVYGISDGSAYVKIDGFDRLSENEVYISGSFGEKYGLKTGGTITLHERYENRRYSFRVAGVYDGSVSIAVFLPIGHYRSVFGLKEGEFTGFLSDEEIADIEEEDIATVITERDVTKMCDQLDHSMGSYMQYFQVLCVLLSAVLIYLLSKIIIEKNETAISMTKILGYKNGEIARLYLLSTTIVLIVSDVLGVLLGSIVMKMAWSMIMASYSGWFAFRIEPAGYLKMFAFILAGYLIVMFFDFRRIQKIPMDEALKNGE